MDFVNPSFPLADAFGLLLPAPVRSSDEFGFSHIHSRPVHARLSAESGDIGLAHRRACVLESVEDFAIVAVEDQESPGGNVVALVAVAEEEEALIGALDFQAVEAGQGSIGSEISVAFPDLVRVGGSDFSDEGNDGALEVERDLHVEIAHTAEHGDDTWQPPAPLGPSGAVVLAEENESNVGAPPNQSLLERVPSGRVLKRHVSSGES